MRGNFDLPVGDRDHEDTRSEKPARYVWPDVPPNMPPHKENEGLGSFLARLEAEGLVPTAVPAYTCRSCGRDFEGQPVVPEDMHVEEAKKKGLTYCSASHLAADLVAR